VTEFPLPLPEAELPVNVQAARLAHERAARAHDKARLALCAARARDTSADVLRRLERDQDRTAEALERARLAKIAAVNRTRQAQNPRSPS
jgi:bacterioferritin (cytochrome b1)